MTDPRLFDPPLTLIGFHRDSWYCEACGNQWFSETTRYDATAKCGSCEEPMMLLERKRIASPQESMEWSIDLLGSMMGSMASAMSSEDEDSDIVRDNESP